MTDILKRRTVVAAKWYDGKYYMGRITKELPRRRYRIKFDDGDKRDVMRKMLLIPVPADELATHGKNWSRFTG